MKEDFVVSYNLDSDAKHHKTQSLNRRRVCFHSDLLIFTHELTDSIRQHSRNETLINTYLNFDI